MINVRRAVKSDARKIAQAEKQYIDCPWTEKQISEEIDNPSVRFFVAEENGEFVGYLSGVVTCDECEVSNIAVSENFRRRGIGKMLFAALEDCLNRIGVRQMFLLVRDGNSAAQGLYCKIGFNVVGKRKNYYQGQDALIMRKIL